MKRELEKFKKIHNLNTDNYKPHLKSVQQSAEKFIIKLHTLGVIDDNLLKHTIGVKFYEGKGYQKIPGSLAKYFNCEKPGYAYPLFKTHELHPDKLIEASISEIPTRLLQSAGNITTSRITTFLELILQRIIVKFCEAGINEYCRDSKYLERLDKCKKSTTNMMNADALYIVAADVKALYPSVSRPHSLKKL